MFPESCKTLHGGDIEPVVSKHAERENLRKKAQIVVVPSGKDGLVIGRDLINHSGVSARHARVGRDKKGYWVEDLDSTNGAYVDGGRLAPRKRLKIVGGKDPMILLGSVPVVLTNKG